MSTDKQEMQDLLITSIKHVRRQGRPSGYVDDNGSFWCKYRGPDGCSCAAAPFIREYDAKMESQTFYGLMRNFPESLDPVAAKHSYFVGELQFAHDEAATSTKRKPADFMKEYERRIGTIARHRRLVIPPPIAMGALTY